MALDHSSFTCPTCAKKLDAATAADGSEAIPTEGDLSVCFGCGELLKFGANNFLLLGDDLLGLPLDQQRQLMNYSDAFKAYRAGRIPIR